MRPVSSIWFWMMDYCKKKGIPPAETWAWEEAKIAYVEFITDKKGGQL